MVDQGALLTPSPETLMTRYQQGDGVAAEVLVTSLSPQIYRFFVGQVRSREIAEDLLQDFWLRIHAARRTYRSPEPLLPWLYAIARRVRIDQLRRRRRKEGHEVLTEVLPEAGTAMGSEGDLDFARLMSHLPESQREVITLMKVSGLSVEEVAQATGSTVGSVKQKAHRAYEKLRTLLTGISGGVTDGA